MNISLKISHKIRHLYNILKNTNNLSNQWSLSPLDVKNTWWMWLKHSQDLRVFPCKFKENALYWMLWNFLLSWEKFEWLLGAFWVSNYRILHAWELFFAFCAFTSTISTMIHWNESPIKPVRHLLMFDPSDFFKCDLISIRYVRHLENM